jgi:hypothetical protein
MSGWIAPHAALRATRQSARPTSLLGGLSQYTVGGEGRRSRWLGAVPVVAKGTERCGRRLVTRKKDEPTGSMLSCS